MYYSTVALKALHIYGTLGTSFPTVRVVCKYSVPGLLYKGVTVKLLPISTTENTDNVPKIPGLLIIHDIHCDPLHHGSVCPQNVVKTNIRPLYTLSSSNSLSNTT